MPLYDDLVLDYVPPANRLKFVEGGIERKFSEAAVMLAFAMHIFEAYPEVPEVFMHPDGEHAKVFDIRSWLERQGYSLVEKKGSTPYGGRYIQGQRVLHIAPSSGLGDVVALTKNGLIVAECKGSTLNSRNAGVKSKIRTGLQTAVAQLLMRNEPGERHIAVVPYHKDAELLAKKLAPRLKLVSIEVAFVRENGEVQYAN